MKRCGTPISAAAEKRKNRIPRGFHGDVSRSGKIAVEGILSIGYLGIPGGPSGECMPDGRPALADKPRSMTSPFTDPPTELPPLAIVLLPVLLVACCNLAACHGGDSDVVSATLLPPTTSASPALRMDLDQASEEVELSRFKKQALQSVFVSGGGLFAVDENDLDSSFLELGIGSGIPLGSFDNLLGITPRARIDWIDAAAHLDVPEQLYEFELQFFYRRPLSDRLSVMAIVSPSIRSDLSTSDRAFRVFALGLLNWERIPDRLTLSGGVVMLGRADLPVLPAVGVLWRPSRRTELDLRFPLTKLSHRIAKRGGESETWIYCSGGLGGNTWAVTRRSGLTDELSLRDYRLTAGLERRIKGGGGCFAEVGLAVGRRLEYEQSELEIDLGNAAIVAAGWRY